MMTPLEEKLFDISAEIESVSNTCTMLTKYFEEDDDTAYSGLSGIADHLQRIADELAELKESDYKEE